MSLPVLPLNVAIGALLLVAVACATRRRARPISDDRRLLAWALVGVPLPLAVTMHLLLRLPLVVDEAMFVTGALAFAAGAFLLLGRDDEDSGFRRGADLEPPWWPEFERGFRRYSTEPSRRPERTGVS